MKKLIPLLFLILFIYLFSFNNQIIAQLRIVNNLYFQTYIVSLFPFILFTNLVLKSNIIIDIHRFLIKRNCRFLFDVFVIILTILIGIPGNIGLLNYLKDSNIISSEEKQTYINYFGGISFPFIYLVILSECTKKIIIISLLIIVETTIYYLNHPKRKYLDINYKPTKRSLINKTSYSLLVVLFFLLTFSILTLPFNSISYPYNYFFKSLIEFSYNLIVLSKINSFLSNILVATTISFTSLSLIGQIKAMDSSFNIFEYIKKRALIALYYLPILILFL